MAAVARYLADISALARLRHPRVAAALAPLIESGVVATCGVIEFELRWATRSSAEFDQVRADRDAGYEWLATSSATGQMTNHWPGSSNTPSLVR